MKTYLKSYSKLPKTAPYKLAPKTSRWGQLSRNSYCRLTDRPTVRFLTIVPSVNRPVDRGLDIESRSSLPVDRPVNRGQIQRAELSGGRPSRLTGPPAKQAVHVYAHRSTRLVDQLLSWSTVRSTGRRPGPTFSGIKTWSFYLQ